MTGANPNVTSDDANNEKEQPERSHTGLKIMVALLGIAIVVMLGLIIFKIVNGDHKKKAVKPAIAASQAEALTGVASFDRLTVEAPIGTRLKNVTVAGEDLVLEFKGQGGTIMILINKNTGKTREIHIKG